MTLLLFLKKVWAWLKKWGLWLLAGIAAFGGIVVAAKVLTDDEDTKPEIPIPDLSDEGEKAVDTVVEAAAERDAKLQELAEKHQDLLEELSEEQENELEELAEKPIEEVTAWFDGLVR